MRIGRLLGAVLAMPVMLGGLLLVTAGPAAACSCLGVSEAERVALADAVFVGTLADQRVDPSASASRVWSGSDPGTPAGPPPVVYTFEVRRVYKGAVGARQEIVTPGGGEAGCGGFGFGLRGTGPFLVFAHQSSNDIYQLGPGQYGSSMCSGSRALAHGGEPAFGTGASGGPDSRPPTASLAVGVGVLTGGVIGYGLGMAALRARRRASAQ